MKEECLICRTPLEYLQTETQMECALCHRIEESKTRCIHGHYICNDCHTKGLDSIMAYCLQEKSKNPITIFEQMTSMPFCHMHGPEHHILVGAALLTACHNAGGDIDLATALKEMMARGRKVPGGTCGFWGCCGAAVSTGMFFSILSGATPLTCDSWGQSNLMTAESLYHIGKIGGPRCCKRNSYLSMQAAAGFLQKTKNILLDMNEISCKQSQQNNQCIGLRCPFHPSQKK